MRPMPQERQRLDRISPSDAPNARSVWLAAALGACLIGGAHLLRPLRPAEGDAAAGPPAVELIQPLTAAAALTDPDAEPVAHAPVAEDAAAPLPADAGADAAPPAEGESGGGAG